MRINSLFFYISLLVLLLISCGLKSSSSEVNTQLKKTREDANSQQTGNKKTKQVNTSDHYSLLPHGIPITLDIPHDLKIEVSAFEIFIYLDETETNWINIDNYNINHYSLRKKAYEQLTIKSSIEEYIAWDLEDKTIESVYSKTEKGYIGLDKSYVSGRKEYRMHYYCKTDESIYKFNYSTNIEADKEKVLKIFQSLRAIDVCTDTPELVAEGDTIVDFNHMAYAFKISLPTPFELDAEMPHWESQIQMPDIGRIIISKYTLGNELESAIIEKKKEMEEKDNFLTFLINEPTGFLAHMDDEGDFSKPYLMYYFHRGDEYYYAFKYSMYHGKAIHDEVSARMMYKRIKEASIAQICE